MRCFDERMDVKFCRQSKRKYVNQTEDTHATRAKCNVWPTMKTARKTNDRGDGNGKLTSTEPFSSFVRGNAIRKRTETFR